MRLCSGAPPWAAPSRRCDLLPLAERVARALDGEALRTVARARLEEKAGVRHPDRCAAFLVPRTDAD